MLTRKEFTRCVIEAISALPEVTSAPIEAEPMEIQVTLGQGKQAVKASVGLDNFYTSYTSGHSLESELRRILDHLRDYRMIGDQAHDFASLRPHLMPKLEALRFAEHLPPVAGYPPTKRIYRPIAETLAVCLVLDRPKNIVFLTDEQLRIYEWDVALDELYSIAYENLRKLYPRPRWGMILPPSNFTLIDDARPLQVLEDTSGYAATAALLPEVTATIPADRPRLVAMPHRDILLATTATDLASVLFLTMMSSMLYRQSAYRISPLLFRTDDDTLSPWYPPDPADN